MAQAARLASAGVNAVTGQTSIAADRADTLHEMWEAAVRRFVGDDTGRSVLLAGDGCTVGENADVERPGASVLKVFVAVAAYLAAAEGQLDLHETVSVAELPSSLNPSLLDSLSPDHRFTIGELTRLSLAAGDNRIGEHLVLLLGADRVTEIATSLGCSRTRLRVGFADEMLSVRGRANVTTVADCAIVLDALARLPALDPLRPAMRSSLFNSRILLRMPDEIIASHKTGSLSGVVNDVGIIHAPRGDLIACFLTDGQHDSARTSADIGECARAALDAWEACTS